MKNKESATYSIGPVVGTSIAPGADVSGYGVGLFYARKDWHDAAAWPFGGWLSVADEDLFSPFVGSERFDDDTGFLARGTRFKAEPAALEAGSHAWSTLFALDAAMGIHEGVGVDVRAQHTCEVR